MNERAQAPRFQAYFQRVQGQSVLTWPRERWDEIIECSQEPVFIDITNTPMNQVAKTAPIIACTAEKTLVSEGSISIIRFDEADEPTPYNTDRYKVLRGESIQRRPDFKDMVLACGTTANANINNYFRQNVFLIKEDPGQDHWLSFAELPGYIKAKIQID